MDDGTDGCEVRLLGDVAVLRDGTDVGALGPRGCALIALLALARGAVVHADDLLTAIWGPGGRRNSLQAVVSRARRQVGDDIVLTRRPGYVLAVDPERVDALAFRSLIDIDDAEPPALAAPRLSEALALWRGPALSGVEDAPGLVEAAERLGADRDAAAERLAAALVSLGDHGRAGDTAREVLMRSPGREDAAHITITALAQAGRREESLAAFTHHARHLRENLGIDPAPRIAAAQRAVLQGSHRPATSASRDGRLPMLGRAAHVAALDAAHQAARDGDDVWVLVQGPAGAGASRLLRGWAERTDGSDLTTAQPAERHHSGAVMERLDEGAQTWIIDQAHHTDSTSLAAVAGRSGRGGTCTVLAIRGRPPTSPDWRRLQATASEMGRVVRLRLEPLRAEDLQPVCADVQTATALAEASDGNPHDLHVLVNAALRSRALHRDASGRLAQVPGRPLPEIEQTLPDDGAQRDLLALLAVAGHALSLSVLTELQDGAEDIVDQLEAGGWLTVGAAGPTFADESVAEQVLSRLGSGQRRSLSARIAAALAGIGWADHRPGVLGRHLLAAGDGAAAGPLLLAAARAAHDAGRETEAVAHAEAGLDALAAGADRALEHGLQSARAAARNLIGPATEARSASDAALATATTPAERLEALLLGGEAASLQDDHHGSVRVFAQAAELAEELGDVRAAYARTAVVLSGQFAGHETDPRDLSAQVARWEADTPGAPQLAGVYHQMGLAYAERGQADDGVRCLQRAIDIPSRFADGPEGLFARCYLGRCQVMAGLPGTGIRTQSDTARQARARAEAIALIRARTGLSEALALVGATDLAFAEGEAAVRLAMVHLPSTEPAVRARLVRAALVAGDVERADQELTNVATAIGGSLAERSAPILRQWRLEITWLRGGRWDARTSAALLQGYRDADRPRALVEGLTLAANATGDSAPALEAVEVALAAGLRLHAIPAVHAGDLWHHPVGATVAGFAERAATDLDDDLAPAWEQRADVAAARRRLTAATG